MSAKEKTKAKKGVWKRGFVMLVKIVEKMTYEQRTEEGDRVSHADTCGRQRTKQAQSTWRGSMLGLVRVRQPWLLLSE